MNIKFCKRCTMQFEIADVLPEKDYKVGGAARCPVPRCGLRFWHSSTFSKPIRIKTLVSVDDTNHHNLRPWPVAGMKAREINNVRKQ